MKNKFKTIGLMLCLIAASITVSCNKDNNDENETSSSNASIVGTWGCVYNHWHTWGTEGGVPYDKISDGSIGFVICFKDDGTYNLPGSGSTYVPFSRSSYWMKDDNILILNSHDKCKILILNNSTLKFTGTYHEESEYDKDEYPEYWWESNCEYTYEFKRQ